MKKTEIHIGNLINEVLSKKNIPPTYLAKCINYEKSGIYKILKKPNINTDTLWRISIALKFNFFDYISKNLIHDNEWKEKSCIADF